MTRRIEIGTIITRSFGKKTETWKVTRIELNDNFGLTVYACKEKCFEHENYGQEKFLKQKSYDEDHCILHYNLPSGNYI